VQHECRPQLFGNLYSIRESRCLTLENQLETGLVFRIGLFYTQPRPAASSSVGFCFEFRSTRK